MIKWLLAGIAVSGIYTTIVINNHFVQKEKAFTMAKSLVKDKGIINLGAGPYRTSFAQKVAYAPETAVNVDIIKCNLADTTPCNMPNYIQLDLEQMPWPFNDKAFDVSFSSHSLEHIQNWEIAFNEMRRIADWTVIVLPNPLSLGGQLNPDHKQHFSFKDIELLRGYGNVLVYA